MVVYGYRTRMILKELSEDSRISVTDLAKKLKCSRITTSKILNEVIAKYKVRFCIEVDENKLGLLQSHLVIVKLEKKPKIEDLREIFANETKVNCAFLCKGDFDLIIHATTNDPRKYIMWESLVAGQLADYGVQLHPSQLMMMNFGYLPLTSDTLHKFAIGINQKDLELLTQLCNNSRMRVSELASILKFSRTTVHYRIHTLLKKGIIKRFTICVGKPPQKHILTYAVNYHFNRTSPQRSVQMMEYYKQYDEELPLLTTFQLLAPLSGSYRFLGIALFNDKQEAIKNGITAHRRIFSEEHVEIKYAQITDVIKGSYPFRNIDITKNYNRLLWKDA